MKKITVTDLALSWKDIVDKVVKGESFVLTRNGTKVALILPYQNDQDEAEERPRQDLSEVLERLSALEQSQSDSSPFDPKKDPSMIKIRKRLDNLESSIESIVNNSSGRTRAEPDADTLDELEEEISSLASRVKHLEIEIKNKSGNYD